MRKDVSIVDGLFISSKSEKNCWVGIDKMF